MNLSKGEQAWRSFLDRMEMASQIESISRLEAARMEMEKLNLDPDYREDVYYYLLDQKLDRDTINDVAEQIMETA